MKRTPLAIAVLVLAAGGASAQSLTRAFTASPLSGVTRITRSPSSNGAPWAVGRTTFGSLPIAVRPSRATVASESRSAASAAPRPWHMGLDFTLRSSTGERSPLTSAAEARFWQLTLQPARQRKADIDWVGLLTQQTRVDAVMHALRLQQPKFHEPLYHSPFFEGYREALEGYYSVPLRWDDGDDFMTNDVGHPIMGAVFSYTFTDYDRRCSNMVFGEGRSWSCMKRATIYASLASANWEWNPVMSESALGHIGKFRTCRNGRCRARAAGQIWW